MTKPTKKKWVEYGMDNPFIFKPEPIKFIPPRIKPMSDTDYHLLDYLMAGMAYDLKGFASSEFTAGSLSHLLRTYGESFTLMGHNIYKHYIREKHSYAY